MTDFKTDLVNPEIEPHHLPSRRKRLKVLMALKEQRRYLAGGVLGLLAACAALSFTALRAEEPPPEVIKLGRGIAGVETPAEQGVAPASPVPSPSESRLADGEASYYGSELAGNRTASGERFDPGKLTAAHRTLPLGSRLRVTNIRTGASVIVRINDRGPYHGNRVIDLSRAAARQIGMLAWGKARVRLALLV